MAHGSRAFTSFMRYRNFNLLYLVHRTFPGKTAVGCIFQQGYQTSFILVVNGSKNVISLRSIFDLDYDRNSNFDEKPFLLLTFLFLMGSLCFFLKYYFA